MTSHSDYTVVEMPSFCPDDELINIKPLPKRTALELAEALKAEAGDLGNIAAIHPAKVLCAVYVRNTVGAGLILAATETQREDIYQGKAFLVLGVGAAAFKNDDSRDFYGFSAKIGDWVAARPADGEHLRINGVDFRLFDDRDIRMIINDPDCVY